MTLNVVTSITPDFSPLSKLAGQGRAGPARRKSGWELPI
jgi:hypothetical protein